MVDEKLVGNGSTIFKTIGLLIAGYTTPWLIKFMLLHFGIDLSGQETELMQGIGLVVAIALSYIDAKFSNTFFNTEKEISLEDYIQYGIDNFNLAPVENNENDMIIEDIDPAMEYEEK